MSWYDEKIDGKEEASVNNKSKVMIGGSIE
jgi:hypothetical protein